MTFKTVFDAAAAGYRTWWFPAFGLIFVAVGVLMVSQPQLVPRRVPSGLPGRARTIFGWFFLSSALLWTAGTFTSTFTQYLTATNALRNGRYSIVEGVVTHFIPMPYTGHAEESFVVGNRRFFYSDYVVTEGFHNAASHGGPIREGLHVRISYVGNLILRLEVAD